MTTTDPTSNAAYPWNVFDAEAYFQHYYGEPHPDDEQVIRCAVAALREALPRGALLDILDVGTGPNLIPAFCALPRARTLTAWDYAPTNVAWLHAELARSDLRPQWRHFWEVARASWGPTANLADNPLPQLRASMHIQQGSIFDLPSRAFDAATMFFCAESITARRDEFDAALAAFARAVRSGGLAAAAFLVRSAGYEVAGQPFPVLALTADDIETAFARHVTLPSFQRIGIIDRQIRSGYAGFVFATGHVL
jgi:hypothetical protein